MNAPPKLTPVRVLRLKGREPPDSPRYAAGATEQSTISLILLAGLQAEAFVADASVAAANYSGPTDDFQRSVSVVGLRGLPATWKKVRAG